MYTNQIIFRGLKLKYRIQYIFNIMPRNKKFNEESVVVCFRVPKSKAKSFRNIIQKIIDDKYKKVMI